QLLHRLLTVTISYIDDELNPKRPCIERVREKKKLGGSIHGGASNRLMKEGRANFNRSMLVRDVEVARRAHNSALGELSNRVGYAFAPLTLLDEGVPIRLKSFAVAVHQLHRPRVGIVIQRPANLLAELWPEGLETNPAIGQKVLPEVHARGTARLST